ncbi:response regulator transcription factor [Sphingobium sufflavum]|uniref:response regulator transcription factor n=1 Tax=Sphingobium sufflavum TaxID=1129547 RepID=UPI001F294E2D|nr:response regulator transcription factor [Sphingobium sufflavum]MCE7796225.1 response regulator transcription factor [Sphingobium sufflavum]
MIDARPLMAAGSGAVKILLVDDDHDLTAMLTEYLSGEGFVADRRHDAATGVAAALTGQYDVVVLDVMLPGSSGIDALRAIRAKSDVPVIMLTAKGGGTDRVLGLELGADDYVSKPYFPPELVARLRAVLRRPLRDERPAGVLRLDRLSCDPARREVRWDDQPVELTATEFNLLVLLLDSGDRVSAKEDISVQLFGRRYESYDRSMDVHISKLRHKLAQVSGDRLKIATVRGIGWKMELPS